jgi:hypothetical protein
VVHPPFRIVFSEKHPTNLSSQPSKNEAFIVTAGRDLNLSVFRLTYRVLHVFSKLFRAAVARAAAAKPK